MRGVLLINLGSPDSTSVGDVRRYLREFLMDARVIDAPWPVRKLIVEGFILPFRPRKSAEAYRAVWTAEGSPLIVISRRQQRLLQNRAPEMPIELAMRYGRPSCEDGIRALAARGVDEFLLFPLYPHYALSSYETAVIAALNAMPGADRVRARILRPFYREARYIEALVESVQSRLTPDIDHVLFSYHGLPERHLRKSDPTGAHCLATDDCCAADSPAHAFCYRHQVLQTTRLFAEKAGLAREKYSVSFQSRLGRDPWLKPFTDHELARLPESGVRRLAVLCPAFVTDCLETLEEIGIRGLDSFRASGGEDLRLIPCLNDHPRWIETLAEWVREPDSEALFQSAEEFAHH